ncbi:ATP-binding protein [Streptomyces sp. NPDC053429]|uniref:ATP-binding protein n=1 Tax=Streptomyces sp. NPDC053429 TaxID=3365702 RepID=UPI0037CFE54B
MQYSGTDTTTAAVQKSVYLSIGQPGGVAEGRRVAEGFLRGLEPAVEATVRDSVALVVSELVTNALRHGGGGCLLQLAAGSGFIDVFVYDASSRPPRMRTPDLNGGAGGFGWPMVHRLSTEVTVTHEHRGGKTIQARMPRYEAEES